VVACRPRGSLPLGTSVSVFEVLEFVVEVRVVAPFEAEDLVMLGLPTTDGCIAGWSQGLLRLGGSTRTVRLGRRAVRSPGGAVRVSGRAGAGPGCG